MNNDRARAMAEGEALRVRHMALHPEIVADAHQSGAHGMLVKVIAMPYYVNANDFPLFADFMIIAFAEHGWVLKPKE